MKEEKELVLFFLFHLRFLIPQEQKRDWVFYR